MQGQGEDWQIRMTKTDAPTDGAAELMLGH